MKKSKAYRTTRVKDVRWERVVSGREGQAVHVGLDMSPEAVRVVWRWGPNDFERPWQVDNPREVGRLVERLSDWGRGRLMVVALEPTGTYGDPLRQALSDAGRAVSRVSPKASHDDAEVFDGVPSQHDGQDAAIVSELAALGQSSPWPFAADAWDQEPAYGVDWLDAQRRSLVIWCGRREGLLARHWPEATRTLQLPSGVRLRCRAEYGCASARAADAGAAARLERWGRGHLSPSKAEELLAAARRRTR